MITEEELIEALGKRDIPVNQRALTDWRQKHYLPPLTSHGRGRGKGKVYYWTDERVIEQAVLVDEIMLSGITGKRINLILWFLGYEVPVALIRKTLLEGVEKFERYMTGGSHSGDKIEDHVSGFVSKYYSIADRYPQLELPADRPPGEMHIFINILVNPEFNLNEIPYMEGARAFIRRLEEPSTTERENEEDTSFPTDDEEISSEWILLRNIFFVGHLKEALIKASDVSLKKVQSDVSLIFAEIAKLLGGIPAFDEFRERRFHAAHDFGVILTFIDLAVRHAGWGEFLDKHIPALPEHFAKVDRGNNPSQLS